MYLFEINDLVISDWKEKPPLVVLVDALVKGLSGGKAHSAQASNSNNPFETYETEIQKNRVTHAFGAIKGVDPGLPKSAPVFDIEEMRKRNKDLLIRRAVEKARLNRG